MVNPLIEYEELILQDGIKKCYDLFLLDAGYLDGNFTSEERIEFIHHSQDNFGRIEFFTESFRVNLDNKFRSAYKQTIKTISNQIGGIIVANDRTAKIISLLDGLEYLYNSIKKDFIYYPTDIIKYGLFKVIIFLQKNYKSENISHPAYDLINAEPASGSIDGFFAFKGYVNDLPKLYNFLVNIGLFSSEETNIIDFKKVFCSPNPQDLNIKLKFDSTQEEASYIIEKIRNNFHNLTDTALIDSGCFQTKQGKNLVLNNFQKARSIFKDNISKREKIKEINKACRLLKFPKR